MLCRKDSGLGIQKNQVLEKKYICRQISIGFITALPKRNVVQSEFRMVCLRLRRRCSVLRVINNIGKPMGS